MIDIQKQVDYWRGGAEEELEVAGDLIENGKIRHGLFFAHLALEKILKAHVSIATKTVPPKIHDLNRLAELGKVDLGKEQLDHLRVMNRFCLHGRYPGVEGPIPEKEKVENYTSKSKEIIECLIDRL